MAKVSFKNVSVEFPVFNAKGQSFTSKVLQSLTGGKLDSDANGKVVVKALSGINIELRDGDRLGVIGHNGAGKSTFLRTLGRIYAPSSGEAVIEGQIGSLIDVSLGINPEATGRENIYIRGALLGIPKSIIQNSLEEIIDFSELGDFIDLPVRTYSSGMQMRLGFSISTLIRPDLLLMDEWLSVGDENFKLKAEQRLNQLIGTTSVLVLASHSKELIEKICNRVILLEHGRVILSGSPKEVLPQYFGA
jgi:lipopolysaccharide transport system ATP-binding protein